MKDVLLSPVVVFVALCLFLFLLEIQRIQIRNMRHRLRFAERENVKVREELFKEMKLNHDMRKMLGENLSTQTLTQYRERVER